MMNMEEAETTAQNFQITTNNYHGGSRGEGGKRQCHFSFLCGIESFAASLLWKVDHGF
jgi:hypothetical protein